MSKTVELKLRLSKTLKNKMRARAQTLDVTMSQLIRILMRVYLQESSLPLEVLDTVFPREEEGEIPNTGV